MKQLRILGLIWTVDPDRGDLGALTHFDFERDIDQFVGVIDCDIGMHDRLKISVFVQEVLERIFSNCDARRIVRVFVRKVRDLQQTDIRETLDRSRELQDPR